MTMHDTDIDPPEDREWERAHQVIHEEHHHHPAQAQNGNGGFAKVRDAVFLAIILAVGAAIWTMNSRLTRMETLMEVMVQGIQVAK